MLKIRDYYQNKDLILDVNSNWNRVMDQLIADFPDLSYLEIYQTITTNDNYVSGLLTTIFLDHSEINNISILYLKLVIYLFFSSRNKIIGSHNKLNEINKTLKKITVIICVLTPFIFIYQFIREVFDNLVDIKGNGIYYSNYTWKYSALYKFRVLNETSKSTEERLENASKWAEKIASMKNDTFIYHFKKFARFILGGVSFFILFIALINYVFIVEYKFLDRNLLWWVGATFLFNSLLIPTKPESKKVKTALLDKIIEELYLTRRDNGGSTYIGSSAPNAPITPNYKQILKLLDTYYVNKYVNILYNLVSILKLPFFVYRISHKDFDSIYNYINIRTISKKWGDIIIQSQLEFSCNVLTVQDKKDIYKSVYHIYKSLYIEDTFTNLSNMDYEYCFDKIKNKNREDSLSDNGSSCLSSNSDYL